MKVNKWRLEIVNSYSVGNDIVKRTIPIVIPPTDGDRIDVIGTSGRYYYNTSKEKFNERLTKEDYLNLSLNIKDKKERDKAMKEIDWTPPVINDNIEIVIKIINGEITLSNKF